MYFLPRLRLSSHAIHKLCIQKERFLALNDSYGKIKWLLCFNYHWNFKILMFNKAGNRKKSSRTGILTDTHGTLPEISTNVGRERFQEILWSTWHDFIDRNCLSRMNAHFLLEWVLLLGSETNCRKPDTCTKLSVHWNVTTFPFYSVTLCRNLFFFVLLAIIGEHLWIVFVHFLVFS